LCNVEHVETSVDHIVSYSPQYAIGHKCTDSLQLVELEAHRDLSQSIVHADMDAFYANVELLFNPHLEGKAFGVSVHDVLSSLMGFDSHLFRKVGKGVLTTASYEARKYGVRSGMPGTFIWHLLLGGVFIMNYRLHSEKIMSGPDFRASELFQVYRNEREGHGYLSKV
jgi:hypothetical protein